MIEKVKFFSGMQAIWIFRTTIAVFNRTIEHQRCRNLAYHSVAHGTRMLPR
jgi:hypothetical protein